MFLHWPRVIEHREFPRNIELAGVDNRAANSTDTLATSLLSRVPNLFCRAETTALRLVAFVAFFVARSGHGHPLVDVDSPFLILARYRLTRINFLRTIFRRRDEIFTRHRLFCIGCISMFVRQVEHESCHPRSTVPAGLLRRGLLCRCGCLALTTRRQSLPGSSQLHRLFDPGPESRFVVSET